MIWHRRSSNISTEPEFSSVFTRYRVGVIRFLLNILPAAGLGSVLVGLALRGTATHIQARIQARIKQLRPT